jgi:hypothetical protein
MPIFGGTPPISGNACLLPSVPETEARFLEQSAAFALFSRPAESV